MTLQVKITPKAMGAYIVSVVGSLDTSTHEQFDTQLQPILDEGLQLLVFDMAALEYISSAGVRSILQARNAVKKSDGQVLFLNMPPQITKVFEIIKAIPSMQIFADEKELDAYLDAAQKEVLGKGE